MQTLKELREKIQALEAERTRLMGEIEGLRKQAEARAAALEAEVGQMREEAKSLNAILDGAQAKGATAAKAAGSPTIQN